MPDNLRQAQAVQPHYEEVDGWSEEITDVRAYDDLPEKAKDYLKYVEDFTGIAPAIVSVGPDRDETLLLRNPFQQ
jgi:adenylosuccinate synthase